MTTVNLGAFSSYELGNVAAAFRAEAKRLPQAPAVQVLRRVCTVHLVHDQRFSDPWRDPTFPARFYMLRDHLTATRPNVAAHEIEARDVVAAIEALAAALEARDA